MMQVSRTLLSVFAVAACLSLPEACVDTSPIQYRAPPTKDAGVADAPTVASDAARVLECRQCVTEDACKAVYDKCNADSRCSI